MPFVILFEEKFVGGLRIQPGILERGWLERKVGERWIEEWKREGELEEAE